MVPNGSPPTLRQRRAFIQIARLSEISRCSSSYWTGRRAAKVTNTGSCKVAQWAASPRWTHPLFKSKPLQSCDHPCHLSHAFSRATHFPWLKGTPALHQPQDLCTAWLYKGAWLYFLCSSLFPSSSYPASYLFWLWSSIKFVFLQNYSL